MKRRLILILVAILVLTSGLSAGCGQKSEPPASLGDWEALNHLLGSYGLPPVKTTEELQSAAWLVSGDWFEVAVEATERLEQHDIPWERTRPFCFLFYWYIEADIELRNTSAPHEFLAAHSHLVGTVADLHQTADELVLMKDLGEPLSIYPTEDACLEGWVER